MASITPSRPHAPSLGQTQTRLQNLVGALSAETWLVIGLMVIGLIAQGLNMFNYPSFTFKDDEGIYASQAWAVLSQGRLSPYTYFYDHSPAGWILMAGWMLVTGGVNTFGSAVDSGRVLMLLLHVGMIPLFYRICRKFGCNVSAAALGTFLFSVSPVAVFYQRMVLLDNIMMFWLLLSLNLLLDGWGRLSRVVFSGICFGLALLSKETAVFVLPVMLYIAWNQRYKHQGRFGLWGWMLPMAMVVSFYPLYALLKGELFPAAQMVLSDGTTTGNVSLWDSLKWQASRGGDGQGWQLISSQWFLRDGFLFAGGCLSVLVNLVRGIRNRSALAVGLLGLMPLVYLLRGGVVFDYYYIFAVPFLAMNLALILSALLSPLPRRVLPVLSGGLALALLAGYWLSGTLTPLYAERPDAAGNEALGWIKENVPANSVIVMRDDLWTDLRIDNSQGPAFANIYSHWKVAQDPEVSVTKLKNDWRSIDYLIMSPGVKEAFQLSGNKLALEALQNAHKVRQWAAPAGNEALHPRQIIELWKVDKAGPTEASFMSDSNSFINSRFGQNGSFASADGVVTSESQSYALLRSVWLNDKANFYKTWEWTRTYLQRPDSLLAWQWKNNAVSDNHAATDADSDTALALLMAGKRWNDANLTEAGTKLVKAIWQNEVTTINNRPYLTAGDWAANSQVVAINPSYFSPYAYRVFKEVDQEHDWQAIIDTGYETLFSASREKLGFDTSAGLPPDWVGLDKTNGQLVPLKLDNTDTTLYGYDAARTYWRIALDLKWSYDGRASSYLKQAGFLRDEVNRKGTVNAVYTHSGEIAQGNTSQVGTAGAVAALLTLDPTAANTLYAGQVIGVANRGNNGISWGDGKDLYTQEWGWFATALYAQALPDYWHSK